MARYTNPQEPHARDDLDPRSAFHWCVAGRRDGDWRAASCAGRGEPGGGERACEPTSAEPASDERRACDASAAACADERRACLRRRARSEERRRVSRRRRRRRRRSRPAAGAGRRDLDREGQGQGHPQVDPPLLAGAHLFELGVFGGLFIAADDHDLYDPATRPESPHTPAEPMYKVIGDFGARIAYFPLRFLGVEGEFGRCRPSCATRRIRSAFVYGARGARDLAAAVPARAVRARRLRGARGGVGQEGARQRRRRGRPLRRRPQDLHQPDGGVSRRGARADRREGAAGGAEVHDPRGVPGRL
jgi:hypothetical protein